MASLCNTEIWKKANLCYMDTSTSNIIVYTKAENVYVDIAKYIEARFNTSNSKYHKKNHCLKKKEIIELMKK